MKNQEILSKALNDFKVKYPTITSGDLQTFILGWSEAVAQLLLKENLQIYCHPLQYL